MKKHLDVKSFSVVRNILRALALSGLLVLGWGCVSSQPALLPAQEQSGSQLVDPSCLEAHVRALSETFVPRNWRHPENLDRTAQYIKEHFQKAGGRVTEQVYTVRTHTYQNVIATFGPEDGERVVVGAHYDAYRKLPGADDNASGVAGLLELGTLLGSHPPTMRVDLVAYTLEEQPFSGTEDMGSIRHAKALKENKVPIRAMLCLEMIGYFTDKKGSQRFPSYKMKASLPSQGNFITVVGDMNSIELTQRIEKVMRGAIFPPVFSVNASRFAAGIDRSDHSSYWNMGYPAVMITDTALYRNPGYHTAADKANSLDYRRMSLVVEGVYAVVLDFGQE